jgi:hypothetical protein
VPRLKLESLLWRLGARAADAVLPPDRQFLPWARNGAALQLEAMPGLCMT